MKTNKNTHHHVEKVWGHEEWITNEPGYCGKVLTIQPGFQCSLHMHKLKTETFMTLIGEVRLELFYPEFGDTHILSLGVGESFTIQPGVYHRFSSFDPGGSIVIEFSTHHEDSDSYRLKESGPTGKESQS